jgi:L-serine dehydratase
MVKYSAIRSERSIGKSRRFPYGAKQGKSGEHRVSLGQAIKTTHETGEDMQTCYKETSLRGLATLNIIEC